MLENQYDMADITNTHQL